MPPSPAIPDELRTHARAFSVFDWTDRGVIIRERPSFEAWQDLFDAALSQRSSSTWAVVDLYIAGERYFGEAAAQAVSPARISPKRLANILWTGRRFPHNRRRPLLSFSHHEAVAGLIDNEEHPDWTEAAWSLLAQAEADQWPVEVLQAEVRSLRGSDGPSPLARLNAVLDRLLGLATEDAFAPVHDHLLTATSALSAAAQRLRSEASDE